MIDYDILESYGTTPTRLKALFTAYDKSKLNTWGEKLYSDQYAEDPNAISKEELAGKLFDCRKAWEDRIQVRIENGRNLSLRNYRFYMAGDLAYENSPITPAKFAHMLYATGDLKMNFQSLYTEVKKASGKAIADEMFVEKDGQIIAINTPKITDFTLNLVRPYIRRSVAAQLNRYENMYPFLKYESRSQSLVSRLRGDIVSERAEIMTDQFGYRRLLGQEIRGMFQHSHSVTMVENSWSVSKNIHRVHDESKPEGYSQKETIEREGVGFAKVHPTRLFYDTRYPLPSLNFDNGIQYVGYWDLITYRDVKNETNFFNTSKVPYTRKLHGTVSGNSAYFDYYYTSTLKNTIDSVPVGAEANDRDANTQAYYSDAHEDEGIWLSHYYEKVVPKQEGMGGYPHPVWVHLIVAGDNTVVFAEILPSRPGYCLSYDEDDSKLVNIGMALDILPYQDQVANLMSQVLYLLQIQNLLIIGLDSDIVPEHIRNEMKNVVAGKKIFDRAYMLEFSSEIEEIFDQKIGQKKPIQIFQASVTNVLDELLKSISTMLRLLERNQMMSPNELGAFVERETSASEVNQVGSTSNDLHSFKSSGIDEARQAQKIIIYESLIACGSKTVKLSVPERYPKEVLEALKMRVTEKGYGPGEGMSIIGTKENLVGEYIFSSRDGAERSSNTESAKVLMELMRYVLSNETTFKIFVEAYGMDQVTKHFSEVFRMAGSPMTLKLSTDFSESNFKNKLNEEEQQVLQKLQEFDQRLAQVEVVAEDYVQQQEVTQQPPQQQQPPPQFSQ